MAKITVAATTKKLPFIYIRQNIRKCSHVYSSIPLTVGHFNNIKKGKSLAENFYLWSLDFVCVISMSYDIRREILTL